MKNEPLKAEDIKFRLSGVFDSEKMSCKISSF